MAEDWVDPRDLNADRKRAAALGYSGQFDPAKRKTKSAASTESAPRATRADLEGIRARTPKATARVNEGLAALSGIARRTPRKTMSMDEKYAKEKPPKARRKTSSATKTTSTRRKALAAAKSAKAPEVERGDLPASIESEKAEEYKAPSKSLEKEAKGGGSKSESQPAPAQAKKRGKISRFVRAVGRGAEAVGRAIVGKKTTRKRVSTK